MPKKHQTSSWFSIFLNSRWNFRKPVDGLCFLEKAERLPRHMERRSAPHKQILRKADAGQSWVYTQGSTQSGSSGSSGFGDLCSSVKDDVLHRVSEHGAAIRSSLPCSVQPLLPTDCVLPVWLNVRRFLHCKAPKSCFVQNVSFPLPAFSSPAARCTQTISNTHKTHTVRLSVAHFPRVSFQMSV